MDWSTRYLLDREISRSSRTAAATAKSHANPLTSHKWKPLAPGFYKLNTDAAFKPVDDSCYVGLIIRDHLGTFVAGQVKKVRMVQSVIEAETAAIHEGFQWLLTLQYQHVKIESDSLLSVQALKRADDILLEVGFVLDECRSILKFRPGFSVYFAKKQANKAAQ